jgi:glycosyltransferase involved in cell wall biosynthesis
MNITYVSNTDLAGRIFNGYELHKTLNEIGYKSNQIVIEKQSKDDTVIPLLSEHELFIRNNLKVLERELSVNAMLFPYFNNLVENEIFKNPDIIHYQLIQNDFLSIADFNKLSKIKKCVWTIHDPWIVTGHCIHPLYCNKWKEGCENCENLQDAAFPLNVDRTNQLWKIKKETFEKVDIDLIVSSNFMINYLKKSPITCHMNRIHKIPFGINIEKINNVSKEEAKSKLNIETNNIVIGFRNEQSKLKGTKYIEEALLKLREKEKITILTVGTNSVPDKIKNMFNVIELGWQNDDKIMDTFYNAIDIFLMPSLAETFGLMSIEAMAHKCAIVVFKDTVLEEITFAPDCGVAVKYKSSDELKETIERLIDNYEERLFRGNLGREIVGKYYKYSDYVNEHIELYKEIFSR